MEYFAEYESPVGTVIMTADGAALTGLWMKERSRYSDTDTSQMVRDDDNQVLVCTKRWLDGYFSGHAPQTMLRLDLRGTAFQRAVWAALKDVPYGVTVGYGALADVVAEKMGKRQMSAQAVGNAVGRNPVMIVIPCHRVVKADGSIGGFSAGLDRKVWLLRHEGWRG